MKKLFLVAALAVFGMSQTNAQVKFGVKAGPQLTNFIGDDAEDAESKIGFHVGGYANIRFSEQLAFQPELLYSFQGAKTEAKLNLSYIQVPLMLKWYAYDGLNFEFGPQVAFNVSGKRKVKNTITGAGPLDGTTEVSSNIDDLETIDFGLNIGAGYELSNGLNFGIRYTHGLTEVIKDSDLKNSVFALGIGYTF